MTWFLVGLVAGLCLNWTYRKIGKALLGKEKWRARALAQLKFDEFLDLYRSMEREMARRKQATPSSAHEHRGAA